MPDRAEFMVNIFQHLVHWTAYLRDESPDEARRQMPEYAQAVFDARLGSSANSHLSELWAVTPDTVTTVTDDLTVRLRARSPRPGCSFCPPDRAAGPRPVNAPS